MSANNTNYTTAQKTKVLTKLFEAGINTEKELLALNLQSILQIKNITIQDMSIITELQTYIKSNKLYSYLGGKKNDTDNE